MPKLVNWRIPGDDQAENEEVDVAYLEGDYSLFGTLLASESMKFTESFCGPRRSGPKISLSIAT